MKNNVVFSFLIGLILFSAIISYDNGLIANNYSENKSFSELTQESYYATSGTEFFNETSFPRYDIATKSLGMLEYPNKINPVIAKFGDNFSIVISTISSASDWNFSLVGSNNTISLDILSSSYVDSDKKWYFNVIPTAQIEGLYDLEIACSLGDDYQTHAVNLVEKKEYPFTFVHISDLHFPSEQYEDNTTDINLQEFEKIRALDPDFVICTGDLIQGPTLVYLDPETDEPLAGEIQLKLALWALDTLNLPVYYIHGNHEFSQSSIVPDNLEANWYRYFGKTRYQNFSYLDWEFIGFGSSFEGLTTDEIKEVRKILAANSDVANVFYYHYDFNSNPSDFISSFPIEVALYGHDHQDKLYRQGHTVYHDQAPLFEHSFGILTITNSTSITIEGNVYNFDLTYMQTDTTNAYSIVLIVPLIAMFYMIIRKRRTKI